MDSSALVSPRKIAWSLAAVAIVCLGAGCSSDASSTGSSAGRSSLALGGQLARGGGGGATSRGGATSWGGVVSSGGLASSGGASSFAGAWSSGASANGAAANSGGRSASQAGTTASSPSGGYPAGGYPATVPPPPTADGSSPYLKECHGDTKDCVDVANLRCLGIRDGTQVDGYGCSNPCGSDADCSRAPTGVPAVAACVDFVTQKHCLLVCLSDGVSSACPNGMNCYVYPGSPIGYCLWP